MSDHAAVHDGARVHASEPPLTLDDAPVRSLGLWDQLALWGSLGVSLLLPVTGAFLLGPHMSLGAALLAILVGTIAGNLLLGLAAAPGAETGAPAMVLFRGLFGRRGSYVPTALNLAQCVGWSTFEIVVIAESGNKVIGGGWRWPLVLVAGVVATSMAIRPLAFVRVLKRYLVWVVLASTVYLFVEVLRHHLPGLTDGTWNGFWPAVDLVAALAVSWMPLAADYTRQARSAKEAFWGAAIGYGVTSAAFFVLGVLVFVSVGGDDVLGSLLAIPAGTIALLVLAVDEIDEAFANIYSTAVSAQNIVPRVDRRVLAVVVGALATVLALVVDIEQYQSFLYLLGSVFVPLFAVFIIDYYVLHRRDWDVSETAPARWSMLVPWLAGFVTYQLVNPGQVGWWQRWWVARQDDAHFHPPSWLSASLASFVVAAALTLLVATTRRGRRPAASPVPSA